MLYAPQPLTTLSTHFPDAHFSLNRGQPRTPRCTSTHPKLYAFPKAFQSKPVVCMASHASYCCTLRPREGRNSTAWTCRYRLSRSICASNFALPFASVGPRRPSDSLLRVARGVEESRRGPKLVFHAEDVGADIALPTTEMFCMSFVKILGLLVFRALGFFHGVIPEVEGFLSWSGC